MKLPHHPGRAPFALYVLAACLSAAPMAVHADEREDLEKLRATVLGLMDALIKSGVLPRDKADALMREAEKRATTSLAQSPPPEVGADGKKIVRVPYVPEAVKIQMREEIKAEVLAQTRAEGGPGPALTETGSRLRLEGDMRLRAEAVRPDGGNTAAKAYSIGNPDVTRAADFWGNRNANTQESLERTRVRARLGFNFDIAPTVTTGLALSTGNVTGPTSTNQTMAQGSGGTPGYFNKYTVVVDKAFIKLDPVAGVSVSGGRFRNPFMATDLVWADDLNFEGLAVSARGPRMSDGDTFFTAGWFPLSFGIPGTASSRNLVGLQGGLNWQLGTKDNRVKLAGALYNYSGIEGVKQTTTDTANTPGYLNSEYGSGYRSRGNTLFRINTLPTYDTATNWGLASGFRLLDLTASMELAQFDPLRLIVSGDLVRNLSFDRNRMSARAGVPIGDGSGTGYLAKVQLGTAAIAKKDDWNVALSYRHLGSDAVLDAFTNSDFGGGGTNNKGFVIAGSYGLAKNTWVSGRWMSSDTIDSAVPAGTGTGIRTKYSIDTVQVDFNVRY